MKKFVLIAFVVLTSACQQKKIGYVDNIKLMDSYQEKIDVEAKYKAKAETLARKRDSISQAFQLELQEFQANAQRMAQNKAQEQYGLLQQRGQFMGQQLQQEEQQIQLAGQTEIDSVVSKVKKRIKAYGKSNQYTYILTGGEGGAVLYGTDVDDLTDEIVKILNEDYKK